MSELNYRLVVSRSEEWVTLEVLASYSGLHPRVIERFVDYGLIEPAGRVGTEPVFGPESILRLRTIHRLRRDIGANLAGIGVILDLIDRIQSLQREVDALKSRL